MQSLTIRVIFLLCTSLVLIGCGSFGKFDEQNLVKNPKSFIGKFYEIAPGQFFAGSTNFDAAMDLKKVVESSDARQAMREHYKQKGSFNSTTVFLNIGNNSEDSKASLLVEVVDAQVDNPQHAAVQVKCLNKKFFGTKWWVSSTVLFDNAVETSSPVANRSMPTAEKVKKARRVK